MLGNPSIARFAPQPNPQREARLLWFAGSTGGGQPDDELQQQTPPPTAEHLEEAETAAPAAADASLVEKRLAQERALERTNVREVLPDIVGESDPNYERAIIGSETMFRTLALGPNHSGRIVQITGERLGRNLHAELREVNRREDRNVAMKEFLARSGSFSAEERRAILQRILATAEDELGAVAVIEDRLGEYEELLRNCEIKKNYFLNVLGPGARTMLRKLDVEKTVLAAYLDKDLQDVRIAEIERTLGLEERGATPAQVETRRTAIREMLAAEMKLRTFAAAMRPGEREWERGEHAGWQRRYLETLRAERELLLGNIKRRIEAEADDITRADMAKRLAFEKKLESGDGSLDRKCLDAFKCTYTSVRHEFDERGSQLKDIVDHPLGDDRVLQHIAAGERLRALAKLRWEGEQYMDCGKKEYFAVGQQRRRQAFEDWAYETGLRLREVQSLAGAGDQASDLTEALEGFLGNDPWGKLRDWHDGFEPFVIEREQGPGALEGMGMRRSELTEHEFPEQERSMIDLVLACIAQGDVDTLLALADERKQTERDAAEALPDDVTITREMQATHTELERLIPDLIHRLNHPVCDALKMPKTLWAMSAKNTDAMFRTESALERALAQDPPMMTEELDTLRRKANLALRAAERTAAQVAKTMELLADLDPEKAVIVSPHGFPPGKAALYDFKERKMLVRSDLSESERAEAIEHERGHAITHLLTRRTRLLPFLLTDAYERLRARTIGGETFEKALRKLEDAYGFRRQSAALLEYATQERGLTGPLAQLCARSTMRRLCFDELMNRYALWNRPNGKQEAGSSQTQELELELFDALKEAENVSVASPLSDEAVDSFRNPSSAPRTKPAGQEYKEELGAQSFLPFHDDDDLGDEDAADGEDGGGSSLEKMNLKQELLDIQRGIGNVRDFLNAFPDLPSDVRGDIEAAVGGIERDHGAFDRRFRAGDESTGLKAEVKELSKRLGAMHEAIQAFDKKQLDISGVPKTLPSSVHDRWAFISINDVVKFVKDTMEDFKSIYKRAHDREMKDAGETLTKWMGGVGKATGTLPFWGFGSEKYLTGVKQYHVRRYAGEEVEAVEKWKKAMENEDSHAILHILEGSKNRDQIKACLELLSDRGEMDWNDEGIWGVLSRISGYRMPIEACRRDDVLRDTWLRKMITEIWNDKEKYYHWRATNDSKIDSGKKSFERNVDQLSNVAGDGMGAELERQLRLYREWKYDTEVRHIHRPFPTEVKSHLYEEVLEYAIVRGKMSMEQKFYYLVQGVAYGLLSIDRLRVLAGTHLSIFPLIDYFYHKNNTLPFIQALARRLEEPGDKKYVPGLRTTLWLHYEVAREGRAQERLSKALSGTRAENIDHEDIPWFLTNLGWNHVDNMSGVVSGTRMKVSPEGWKNLYVGYSSKLKIFGARLLAEREGIVRVTNQEVEMLAQTLMGYVHIDNVLTRNVCNDHDPRGRPMMTEEDFDTKAVSGVSGSLTGQYRSVMNVFMDETMDAVRGIMREKIDRNAFGPGLTEEQFAQKREEFLTSMAPSNRTSFIRNAEQKSIDVYKLKRVFYDAFMAAVRDERGRQAFKRALAANADKLMNEGGNEDLKATDVVEYLRAEGGRTAGTQASEEYERRAGH